MKRFKSIDDMAAAAGQEIGVSDWTTIDQARVSGFADVTGDHQWVHVDVERARRELPTKGTIVHGLLALSLIPALARTIADCDGVSRIINYGLNKVRFTQVIPTGAKIRVRAKLLSAERRAGGMQFTHEYRIELEGEERPACMAEMITILYP